MKVLSSFVFSFLMFLSAPLEVHAQTYEIDSLRSELARSQNDTTKLLLMGLMTNAYRELVPDSALTYSNKMQSLAIKLNLKLEEAFSLTDMGYALINLANYPRSLQALLKAEEILIDPQMEENILSDKYPDIDEHSSRKMSPRSQRLSILGRVYQSLGIVYWNANIQPKALIYYRSAAEISDEADNMKLQSITYATLGRTYLAIGQQDSATYWLQKAFELATESGYSRYKGSILLNLGNVYSATGDLEMARHYYLAARVASAESKYYRGVVASCLYLAQLSRMNDNTDSMLFYINEGLPVANYLQNPDLLLRCYEALAQFYELTNNSDSTVKYLSKIIEINNEKFNTKRIQEFQNIDFNKEQQELELEAAQSAYRAKLRFYAVLVGLVVAVGIAVFIWRNSIQRQKSNFLLSKQKESLEIALQNLTQTQNQLIQSEKMASLGELTAGIAHEIQNPLNFVNNFAEVNSELIAEINQALESGDNAEAKNLAKTLDENEKKISYHGKRADGIVKSMLQHSRSNSGKKEPTDINALAEEYLRLAYHGLRAKDKSFNARFETELDPSIEKIEVVRQEIGRVLLNLINNSFYSVSDKRLIAGEAFEPRVVVSTKKLGDKVEIRIQDNGGGVPDSAKDKIFQPFFTTKPTGHGTGLGLSMSYDIITNSHHGEIKVESVYGEGATFIIVLPTTQAI